MKNLHPIKRTDARTIALPANDFPRPYLNIPRLEPRSVAFLTHSKPDIIKRVFDLVVASSAIAITLPLMGIIALAIRLDSAGPAIFKQKRTGLYGRPFTILKFRTMTMHNTPEHVLDYVKEGDPRVTRIGRLLRKTSLDELPQLFNVIKGDLSIVGPRPQPANYLHHYGDKIDGYRARLAARPGITGPVQISALRSATDSLESIQARVNLELYYMAHQSLKTDIKICLCTALAMLLNRSFDIHSL